MTRQQRQALLVLAVALLALAAWYAFPRSKHGANSKAPPQRAGDAVWRSGYPVGHVHLCQPGDILGGPLGAPHPLYSRPRRPGHNRTGLIDYGWDWILQPPSDWDFGNQAVT